MIDLLLIFFGKIIIFLSKYFNLGSGSTWPGHIALKLKSSFIRSVLGKSNTKVVIVAGTNGKTTTGRLITSIIREDGKSFLQNKAGANLVNGLASTIIRGSTLSGRLNKDYLIFESDEYALPQVIEETKPDYIVCLNLFRDQLDRYGEIDSIAKRWHESFKKLSSKTKIILNADDPQIAFLSKKSKADSLFFGLNTKNKNELSHGADTTHCPNCSSKLDFKSVYFSHLGDWICSKCGLKKPKTDLEDLSSYPLPGTYNKYNALASALFAKAEKIPPSKVLRSYTNFTPAFGRQEKLTYKGKKVQIFLSKNPTSFNESLETIKLIEGKNLLIILNNKFPDGVDVSWIWDVNFEEILSKEINIAISGDRTYDMALRIKYAGFFAHSNTDLDRILNQMANQVGKDETLFILPNYTAMLEVRKIITGKRLL